MRPLELDYDPQQPVIEAIQAGDTHAMAGFIQSQERWVRAVVFGVVGRAGELDDVCQKVWIQVWRECRSLTDTTRWRPWLYRIARNAATDSLRSGLRRRRLMGGSDDDVLERVRADDSSRPERQVLAREQFEAVQAAIEALPELYREPFVLKHVEGWSYAEIAEVMGLPPDTVETRLVRARRLLREKLSGRI